MAKNLRSNIKVRKLKSFLKKGENGLELFLVNNCAEIWSLATLSVHRNRGVLWLLTCLALTGLLFHFVFNLIAKGKLIFLVKQEVRRRTEKSHLIESLKQ